MSLVRVGYSVTDYWTDLIAPREHGSWSLALEPLVLALLVAPSLGGIVLTAAALLAMLARRPLKICIREVRLERRQNARFILASISAASAGLLLTVALTNPSGWWPWLALAAVCALLFGTLDVKNEARSQLAEIAGTATFCLVSAAIVELGCGSSRRATCVAIVAAARCIPTVLFVRTYLRSGKAPIGTVPISWGPSLVAAGVGVSLVGFRLVPSITAFFLVWFGFRAVLLAKIKPRVPARTIGISEMIAGASFVLATGLCWPR